MPLPSGRLRYHPDTATSFLTNHYSHQLVTEVVGLIPFFLCKLSLRHRCAPIVVTALMRWNGDQLLTCKSTVAQPTMPQTDLDMRQMSLRAAPEVLTSDRPKVAGNRSPSFEQRSIASGPY